MKKRSVVGCVKRNKSIRVRETIVITRSKKSDIKEITMPVCMKCKCYKPGFGIQSRERNGLIQCLDCYAFCKNTYWKKISHCKRCPKRKTTAVCYCPREDVY